jgi:hypothetical protein
MPLSVVIVPHHVPIWREPGLDGRVELCLGLRTLRSHVCLVGFQIFADGAVATELG